jgi:hypothetical protein
VKIQQASRISLQLRQFQIASTNAIEVTISKQPKAGFSYLRA